MAVPAVEPLRLADVPCLNNASCHIKDTANVERLLNAMATGGARNLQLVSDFDFTLTRQYKTDLSPMPSSFCILHLCKSMPEAWRTEAPKAVLKYRPIEQDSKIPIEERVAAMEEWSRITSSWLTGFEMSEEELFEAAQTLGPDCLRKGTRQMFDDLNALAVPILVFSAGLGDSVVAILKATGVLLPNVKVVSNFLVRQDGLVHGLDLTKMIHTFNKNETALRGSECYDRLHERTNIIVMGDSLGDSDMANGSPEHANVLKIGFLWEKPETNLSSYMDKFDIVLVDDQTMQVPQAILAHITQSC